MTRYLIALFLFLSIGVYGQIPSLINGSFTNAPITRVFDSIEDQTNLKLQYKPEWVDSLTFSGHFVNNSIEEALNELLMNTPLEYYIYHSTIILTKGTKIITTPPIYNKITNQRGNLDND